MDTVLSETVQLFDKARVALAVFAERAGKRIQIVSCMRLCHLRIHNHRETVESARVHMELCGYPCPHQPTCILHIFLQEQIERADTNVGGR